jgi:pyruvate dehydrogenase E2 component (dihydrolipoamide acetyltransferase)
MVDVTMPKLGLTMQEGKIVCWYKNEGDRVVKGEPLFAIETEKITNDAESPASGILSKIVVPVDSTVPVTTVVATIAESGEGEAQERVFVEEAAEGAPSGAGEKVHSGRAQKVNKTGSPTQRPTVKVSPLAKKIADEHGVNLSLITGTGLGGTITKGDVLKAAESKTSATAAEPESSAPGEVREVQKTVEMSLARRKAAERLSNMHRDTPHVTLTMSVEMSGAVDLRNRLRDKIEKDTGRKLTYTHIFARAAILSLQAFPELNSRLADKDVLVLSDINLGIAVDTENGLIVPVVRKAGDMGLTDLAVKISELMDLARDNKLSLDEITGGTFTISNLGMYDVDAFTPLINPPECAILGIGKMCKRAWVVDDQLEIRPVATFSLTFDHRITDGAGAAKFLKKIKDILENPETIAD